LTKKILFNLNFINMKKFFILILTIVLVVGAMAQQETSGNEATSAPYKLEKGSITTELNFSPFSINHNFTMPALRLRYAFSNKLALRANIGLDFGHNKIKENLDDTQEGYYFKEIITGSYVGKGSYTEFSFAPGIEYHFGKWERLSLYVGGELLFGFRTTQTNTELNRENIISQRDYYDNTYYWVQTTSTISTMKTKNCAYAYDLCSSYYAQTGKMFFGINALAGFDVYVYKGLYLGAEIGFGYISSFALKGSVKGNSTIEITTPEQMTKKYDTIDEVFNDKISDGKLTFKCNPMIRLGWRF